jgi:hypothetical protein
MFATAALVDMKFKDDRRKQWDVAIAEAKSSSNVVQAGGSSPSVEGAADKIESSQSDLQTLVQYMGSSILGAHERSSIPRPTLSGWDEPILTPLSKHQDTTLEAQLKALGSHVQGTSIDWGLQTAEEGSVPAEMNEAGQGGTPKHRKKLRDRVPKCSVHQEHMKQMVLKLVTRFLISKESLSTDSTKVIHPTSDLELEAKIMAHQVALLKTGTIWQPKYSPLYAEMVEERKSLNKSITTFLTKETSNPANIKSVVAKICYNLLISSGPPSIDTYNIMLVHFTRLQQHHFAQAVVDSFFQDSRFRPTSCTVAAILDHYVAKGDRVGFESVVHRMRGTAGNMRLRARHLSELGDSKVQSWAQEWKVIHRNSFLISKMPRDAAIFNSLILGSLRVVGIRRAVMYLKAALREGCHISKDLFIRVAQVCLSERNKRAAVTLLSAIISRWHQCQGSWRLETYAGSREIILQLMDLCGIELSANDNQCLLGDLRKVGFHVFNAWLRAVRLEVLDGYIRRSAESIQGLEILLATPSSKAFTNQQIVMWMLELIDCHPVREPRREPGALVTAMQLVKEGFSSRCKEMEAQLLDIIYAGLSADCREKYSAIFKRSPQLDMALKLAIVRNLRQKRPEVEAQNGLIMDRNHQIPDSISLSKAKLREWKWQPSVVAAWT